MSNDKKIEKQLKISLIMSILGGVLLILGLLLIPRGVIDSSVLVAAGEVFLFAGTLSGIDSNYKAKLLSLTKKDDDSEK